MYVGETVGSEQVDCVALLSDAQKGVIAEAALDAKYAQSQLPREIADGLSPDFWSFVKLPPSTKERLAAFYGSEADSNALAAADWRESLARGALRLYAPNNSAPGVTKVNFATHMRRENGDAAEITLSANKNEGELPWVLTFVPNPESLAAPAGLDGPGKKGASPAGGAEREEGSPRPASRRPGASRGKTHAGNALMDWAYLGNTDRLLQALADAALDEKWGFDDDERPNSILWNYLTYTFYRLQSEGKVLEDRDKGVAAFNTGLVNKRYEELYACFSPSEQGAPWKFDEFCKAGAKGRGKDIVKAFNPLPQRAEYFQRKEDLLFDIDLPFERDIDHILLDNMERLPLGFFEGAMRGFDEASEVLAELRSARNQKQREEGFGKLREIIEDDDDLMLDLIRRIDNAINVTRKRVEWNFRTAVPSFYPRMDTMNLLLPLVLTKSGEPDVALVVELTESGAYLGQTILTMRMAYNNARLVCRPDSDWLHTSVGLAQEESCPNDESAY